MTRLLEAGADPSEEHWALLVHAVRRGCGPAMLRLLAEHGAELDRRGGEWSTPPEQYRTAYQNAILRGQDETAALLTELGASTEVSPEDLAVAALARGEAPATPLPPPAELGAEVDGPPDPEVGTPIAWAARGSQYHRTPGRDYVAVVQRLLAAGAQLEPRLLDFAEGPLAGWLEERI